MPEGDTIWRAAQQVRQALQGQTVDAAASSVSPGFGERIEGSVLEEVESRGKHLLLHFANGTSVHTHLGMQGRWKVTRARQRMTPSQAGTVLTPKWLFVQSTATRAVCEHAAVIEMLARRDLQTHPVLRDLGPDVLVPRAASDGDTAVRARSSPVTTIGELLLDQRVVAGVGNIWRCETLFVCGVDPSTSVSSLGDDQLQRIVDTASRLMTSSLARRPQLWVYRRSGLPCRRCGTRIRSAPLGTVNPRTVYWCPSCQPERNTPATG